jgi:putative tricarboxylic transport membrane protein
MSMPEREVGTREGLVWIGIGILIGILALRLDLGSFRAPGPGFVAFLSALFIAGMGVIMLLARAVSKHRRDRVGVPGAPPPFGIGSWRRLLYSLGLLLGYLIFLEPVGFILTTFLLMTGLFFDFEKRNWASSLSFSTVTTLMSYLVFEVWLRCQLPRGILPWW